MSDSLNAAKNNMSGKYSARKCITYYFTSEYSRSSRHWPALARTGPRLARCRHPLRLRPRGELVVRQRRPASRQGQPAVALPVEGRTRVGLAAGGDFAMAGNVADPVAAAQRPCKRREHHVLRIGIGNVVRAFELDADGEIVAALTPAPA